MTSDRRDRANILFEPAYKLAARLRAREIGAVELLEEHLKAVAARNSAINAVVAMDEKGARAAARGAPPRSR